MHSINTVLLQLFATLMVHEQSFSVGEVVFVDEDGSMHNKILTEEACYTKFSGTDDVYEAALRVPLSVQCKCQVRTVHVNWPKLALDGAPVPRHLCCPPPPGPWR